MFALRSMAPDSDCMPMSTVPPSPAKTTIFLPAFLLADAMPSAAAAAAANAMFKTGTPYADFGYVP
jgi:hypothetical protein